MQQPMNPPHYTDDGVTPPPRPRRFDYQSDEEYQSAVNSYYDTYQDKSYGKMKLIGGVGLIALGLMMFTWTNFLPKIFAAAILAAIAFFLLKAVGGKDKAEQLVGYGKPFKDQLVARFSDIRDTGADRLAYNRYIKDYNYRVSNGYKAPVPDIGNYRKSSNKMASFDEFKNAGNQQQQEQPPTNEPEETPTVEEVLGKEAPIASKPETSNEVFVDQACVYTLGGKVAECVKYEKAFISEDGLEEVNIIDGVERAFTVIGKNIKVENVDGELKVFADKDSSLVTRRPRKSVEVSTPTGDTKKLGLLGSDNLIVKGPMSIKSDDLEMEIPTKESNKVISNIPIDQNFGFSMDGTELHWDKK